MLHQAQGLGHVEEKSAWLFLFVCLFFLNWQHQKSAGSVGFSAIQISGENTTLQVQCGALDEVLISVASSDTPFQSQSLVSHGGAASKAPRAQSLPSLQLQHSHCHLHSWACLRRSFQTQMWANLCRNNARSSATSKPLPGKESGTSGEFTQLSPA